MQETAGKEQVRSCGARGAGSEVGPAASGRGHGLLTPRPPDRSCGSGSWPPASCMTLYGDDPCQQPRARSCGPSRDVGSHPQTGGEPLLRIG